MLVVAGRPASIRRVDNGVQFHLSPAIEMFGRQHRVLPVIQFRSVEPPGLGVAITVCIYLFSGVGERLLIWNHAIAGVRLIWHPGRLDLFLRACIDFNVFDAGPEGRKEAVPVFPARFSLRRSPKNLAHTASSFDYGYYRRRVAFGGGITCGAVIVDRAFAGAVIAFALESSQIRGSTTRTGVKGWLFIGSGMRPSAEQEKYCTRENCISMSRTKLSSP